MQSQKKIFERQYNTNEMDKFSYYRFLTFNAPTHDWSIFHENYVRNSHLASLINFFCLKLAKRAEIDYHRVWTPNFGVNKSNQEINLKIFKSQNGALNKFQDLFTLYFVQTAAYVCLFCTTFKFYSPYLQVEISGHVDNFQSIFGVVPSRILGFFIPYNFVFYHKQGIFKKLISLLL